MEDVYDLLKARFPFMDCQNVLALYKLSNLDEYRRWAEVQEDFQTKFLTEGLEDGSIQPLRVCNTVNLHVSAKESVVLSIEPEMKGYPTPVIKMEKLRESVKELKLVEEKFCLLDVEGDSLRNPVMEGCDVYFQRRPKKEVPERVLEQSRKRKSLPDIDMEGCFGIFGGEEEGKEEEGEEEEGEEEEGEDESS